MRIVRKFRNLVGRRARLRRLEEEMQTHVELLTEEGIRSGLSAVEARRRAQLAFGNQLATREESEASLGWPMFEAFWQELRLVCRGLIRRPSLSLSVVGILALGIGATGALSSLIRAVYLSPLSVPQPEQIHLAVAQDGQPKPVSWPTVQRMADDPAFLGGVAGYSDPAGAALSIDDGPAAPTSLQFVTAGFFRTLGLAPEQGRFLDEADDRLGEPAAVVVLSWSFWQRRFGGRAGVLGSKLRFNGVPVTVVGIAPKQFRGVSLDYEADGWLPSGMHAPLRISPSAWLITDNGPLPLDEWGRDDCASWLNLLLRLSPAAVPGAEGALQAAWQPHLGRILAIIDDAQERVRYTRDAPHLVAAPRGYAGVRTHLRRSGFTLALLVGVLVLATMTNSATLLLLRLLSRIRELGVRLALGAGRGRLIGSALMEGVVLSSAGAVGGLIFAWWLTPALARWLVPNVENVVGVDGGVLDIFGVAGVGFGLLIGAAPAWAGARLLPQTVLQRRLVGSRESLRLGRGLIVLQLALSVLLVAMAGALALDLRRTLQASFGFSREGLISSRFDLAGANVGAERYPGVLDHLRAVARELPQVQSVAFAASGPLTNSTSRSRIWFRGTGVEQPAADMQHECADPAYFATMGMPLLQGRGFAETDNAGAPRVAVVSRSLALATFGDADPVGRRFGFDASPSDDDWEIVGVVADARVNSVHVPAPQMFYTPLAQWRAEPGFFAVRVAGDAAAVRQALAAKVAAAEPSLLFSNWLTMRERIENGVCNDLVTARLTACFGLVATVLAGIGVFGTLGYLVSARSHGIAVRLAVGADPGTMWRAVVREAGLLGMAGVGGGALLAWLLPQWLGAWMTAEVRLDWFALGVAMVVGLLAAVMGSLSPARRATEIDPLVLLKAE